MDSGNSGSMQSSSGGDEEYDSHSFFHRTTTTTTSLPAPPPLTQQQQQQPPFFDSLSNFLDSPLLPFTPPQHNTILNPSLLHLHSSTNLMNSSTITTTAAATTTTTSARPSKKRSRASRRAPTTVLTTDTTNFRAMVQEFTGIPSPPFPNSSSFPRSRFDFFPPTSSSSNPPFLLKPFPQKFPHTTTATATATGASINAANNYYSNCQPSSSVNSLGFPNQAPFLNFQNLLQSPLMFTKPQHPAPATSAAMDGGLPGLVGSGWVDRSALEPPPKDDHDQPLLRRVNVNGVDYGSNANYSKVGSSCKVNYSTATASAQFNIGEKGTEGRGEGMLDQWICSSD